MAADPGRIAPDSRPEDFVQSVGRALRVLEVVGQRPGLPVKAIARLCGLNISTTYHLVRTLAYEGYLVRRPDGTYQAGEAVARRFHDLVSTLGRPPGAAVVLRHLADRVGLSVYLAGLQDDRVVVVEVAEGPGSPFIEDLEVGLDVSAHATALGKALLSALEPRRRRSFLREHELRPFTRRTLVDLDRLEWELEAVPPGGAVEEHGEFRDGVSCAAVVVPGRGGPGMATRAVGVATWDPEVPAAVHTEVARAARDLVGLSALGQ